MILSYACQIPKVSKLYFRPKKRLGQMPPPPKKKIYNFPGEEELSALFWPWIHQNRLAQKSYNQFLFVFDFTFLRGCPILFFLTKIIGFPSIFCVFSLRVIKLPWCLSFLLFVFLPFSLFAHFFAPMIGLVLVPITSNTTSLNDTNWFSLF